MEEWQVDGRCDLPDESNHGLLCCLIGDGLSRANGSNDELACCER